MSRPIALSCPLCGGAVEAPSDRRQVACRYCGRRLHYCGDDFIPRLWLGPGLPDEEFQRRFFELLKTPLTPGNLRRSAVVLHRRRIFFPLYVVAGTRGGILKTVKERFVQEPGPPALAEFSAEGGSGFRSADVLRASRTRVEATPDSRVVLGDFLYVYSAAAAEGWDFDAAFLQEIGKARLDEMAPASLSDMAGRGEVIEATIPVERVLELGVASWQGAAGARPDILESSVRILYLPLLEVAFRCGEQVHRVLFEAVEGRPLAGTLPFRSDWATLLSIPAAGLMGLLLGKGARVMLSIGDSGVSAQDEAGAWIWFALFGFVVLGFGMQVLWLLLRAPLEVQLLTGGGGKLILTQDPEESPVAPLQRWAIRTVQALVSGRRA